MSCRNNVWDIMPGISQSQFRRQVWTLLVAVTVSIMLRSPCARATPTTGDQAAVVVAGWLSRSARPMGTALGTAVGQVETFNDEQNQPLYHIVHVTTDDVPTGFVIVSADDEIEPIIGFAPGSTYDPSPENPLAALVNADLPARLAEVRSMASQPISPVGLGDEQGMMNVPSDRASQAVSRGNPASMSSQAKWRQLAGEQAMGMLLMVLGTGYPIYDPDPFAGVRVGPIVQSRWSQQTVGGAACYNYYTPRWYDPGTQQIVWQPGESGNDPCGCTATAMAQIMRYHRHPTEPIDIHDYPIAVDGYDNLLAPTLGGTGALGAYDWDKMPLVPDAGITEAQRQEIGRLCRDAGVAAHMRYSDKGSGAYAQDAKNALKSTFGYLNAVYGSLSNQPLDPRINPSLDAGYPCLLGIRSIPLSSRHEVVVDGYGYDDQFTLYHHVNLGWGPVVNRDGWYNLPRVYGFVADFWSIDDCVYNIFPAGTGEIISGRTLDSTGQPVANVEVTAQREGGDTYTATSNDKGIYALMVRSNGRYTLTAYGYPVTLVLDVGSSSDAGACGNVWGADFPPTPPTAMNGSALTRFDQPVAVTLQASDDGQPARALDYIITALPGDGSLRDPSFFPAVISSVPYTLLNQGRRVVYTPDAGFTGPDGFTFKTSDGGSPPDGGDSDPASITLMVSNAFYQQTMEGSQPTGWFLQTNVFEHGGFGGWYSGLPLGAGVVWPSSPPVTYLGPKWAHSGTDILFSTFQGNFDPPPMHTWSSYAKSTISCLGYANVRLRFWRWMEVRPYNIFSSDCPHAKIEVSTDSSPWSLVWENGSGEPFPFVDDNVTNNGWNRQWYDLNVPGNQTIYVRWGIEPSSGSFDWSIDGVELVGDTIPSTPSPSDNAAGVSLNSSLSWADCTFPDHDSEDWQWARLDVRYDVYLGPTSPPTTVVAADVSSPACTVGALQANTTYYWRVKAKGIDPQTGEPVENRETESPVWRFTTCAPPIARGNTAGTSVLTPVTIALRASDDGLPYPPPGRLTYIVTSLPSHGSLSDPNGGQIESVPYPLASGGNSVIYTPEPRFMGSDGFAFKANDGGEAPGGGDSNKAPISVRVGIYAALFDVAPWPQWSTMEGWAYWEPYSYGLDDFGGPLRPILVNTSLPITHDTGST